jgi:hypothetical protein
MAPRIANFAIASLQAALQPLLSADDLFTGQIDTL